MDATRKFSPEVSTLVRSHAQLVAAFVGKFIMISSTDQGSPGEPMLQTQSDGGSEEVVLLAVERVTVKKFAGNDEHPTITIYVDQSAEFFYDRIRHILYDRASPDKVTVVTVHGRHIAAAFTVLD